MIRTGRKGEKEEVEEQRRSQRKRENVEEGEKIDDVNEGDKEEIKAKKNTRDDNILILRTVYKLSPVELLTC